MRSWRCCERSCSTGIVACYLCENRPTRQSVFYAQCSSGGRGRAWFDKLTMSGDKLTMSGDKLTMSGDKLTMSGDKLTMSGDKLTMSGDKLTMSGPLILSLS